MYSGVVMKLYYANSPLKDANVVILGLPYDRTVSFIPGTRLGPEYIRICSENIEEYSPYQEKSLSEVKIHDAGDVYFETQDWQSEVHKALGSIGNAQRLIALGGEHTITLPIISWLNKKKIEFSIIHFDAHCDLRDTYLNEKICHATVMRRVSEIVSIDKIYQFGIRSGTKEEFAYGKNLSKFNVYEYMAEVLVSIKEPLYISIDVDVLDPGVVPGVGTPEPGGISYKELIDSLLLLKNKQVIGADIVEYNPLAASPWQSGSTVAEILRELILVITQ
jgi:agmatinase